MSDLGASPTIERRFWAKVARGHRDECWNWTAGRDAHGYGRLSVGTLAEQRMQKAHRVSWMLAHGPIPDGLFVCHRCDNPSCVNPDHLFLGTNTENLCDASSKGRISQARLTAEQVREIRALKGTLSVRGIAARFGVSSTTTQRILQGRMWKHVGASS